VLEDPGGNVRELRGRSGTRHPRRERQLAGRKRRGEHPRRPVPFLLALIIRHVHVNRVDLDKWEKATSPDLSREEFVTTALNPGADLAQARRLTLVAMVRFFGLLLLICAGVPSSATLPGSSPAESQADSWA
jgi:hypothetical protein